MSLALTRPDFRALHVPHMAFRREWSVVGLLAVIDALWSGFAGFSFAATPLDFSLPLIAMAIALGLRAAGRYENGALIGEYMALSACAILAFAVLSYLCCAVDRPLADDALLRLDRAMGFDWLGWFEILQAHPTVKAVLRSAYATLPYQALYFAVLFGLLHQRARLREMFWIVFVAGLFTSAGSVALPALGTFKAFGLDLLGGYLPAMEQLRAGTAQHFMLGQMTGVVSFPSFHTTMALVYVYGFRGTGAIGRAIALLNVVMLLAVPFSGGHYLVDVLGGAAVALASVVIARRIAPRAGTSPQPAAA